jgi:acetylglutamate kinase
VLVHGGGPQSTHLAERSGVQTQFVDGRRVTDEATLDVATMVLNGEINTRIVAACRELGLPAVGISGVDAGLIQAHKRPRSRARARRRRAGRLRLRRRHRRRTRACSLKQLDNDLVPVVSPISADDQGTLLNINADTVARRSPARWVPRS